MPKISKKKFYAVAVGHQVGIYDSWEKCQAQTKGFSKARYKSFSQKSDAEQFVQQHKRKEVSVATAAAGGFPISDSSSSSEMVFDQYYIIQLNFDGGARGNPGTAGAGAYITILMLDNKAGTIGSGNTTAIPSIGLSQPQKSISIRKYLNKATNNFAEYQGLLCGLERVQSEVKELLSNQSNHHHASKNTGCRIKVIVQGDSDIIIQQMNGSYQCKAANLKPLYKQAKYYISQTTNKRSSNNEHHLVDFTFQHVYRKDNAIADKLANEAMDQQRSWETVSRAGEESNPIHISSQNNVIPLVRQSSSRLVSRKKHHNYK